MFEIQSISPPGGSYSSRPKQFWPMPWPLRRFDGIFGQGWHMDRSGIHNVERPKLACMYWIFGSFQMHEEEFEFIIWCGFLIGASFCQQAFFNLKLLQDSWNNQLMISSFSRQLEGNMVCHLRRKNHMIRRTQAEETQRAIEEAESTSAGASEENMRSDNFFHHWRLFKYECKRHVSKLVLV